MGGNISKTLILGGGGFLGRYFSEILGNTALVHTRTKLSGISNSVEADIQTEMGISPEEAESLKISASMRQPVPEDVIRIMGNSTDYISKEIQSTVEFYNTTSNENPISRIFVSGGASVLPSLNEAIAKQTGLKVEPINPFARLQLARGKFTPDYVQQIQPFAVLAVGLALRREANE